MAKPLSFCVEQLKENSGIQFDPDVVKAAVAVIERGAVQTQTQTQIGEHEDEGMMPMMTSSDDTAEVRVDEGLN